MDFDFRNLCEPIIGVLASAVVAYCVTKYQINKSYEKQRELEKEMFFRQKKLKDISEEKKITNQLIYLFDDLMSYTCIEYKKLAEKTRLEIDILDSNLQNTTIEYNPFDIEEKELYSLLNFEQSKLNLINVIDDVCKKVDFSLITDIYPDQENDNDSNIDEDFYNDVIDERLVAKNYVAVLLAIEQYNLDKLSNSNRINLNKYIKIKQENEDFNWSI